MDNTKMDNLQARNELTAFLTKTMPVLAPILLAIVTKVANNYKNGRRVSFLATVVIISLAACGAILGYWVSKWLNWQEYKMTLTIYFFGLFSDKLFEFIFSKTFINGLFNMLQDWLMDNLRFFVNKSSHNRDTNDTIDDQD